MESIQNNESNEVKNIAQLDEINVNIELPNANIVSNTNDFSDTILVSNIKIVSEVLNKKLEEKVQLTEPTINEKDQIKEEDINTSIYAIIKDILLSDERIKELLLKSKIELDANELKKFSSVIDFLNSQSNYNQINQIITALKEILSDGKIELYEIPELISIVYSNISYVNLKLTEKEISILLKLIIYILMETNVIKINSQDFILISKTIDSSLKLSKLSIKILSNNECKCLYF